MITMSIFSSKRLALITFVYWFLLLYIIVALVWWFISLHQQNVGMTDLLINEVSAADPNHQQKVDKIYEAYKRKNAQYVGEGLTFLALIVVGAVYVYRATRRQLRLSQQQQNFMMTVTHELKTPIAIARLNLETLQRRQLPEEQQKKLISNTLHEADRLNLLCNNILLASQLDAGAYKSTKSNVDISDIAERAVMDFAQRFHDRQFEDNIEEGISLYGEELLLQMLMSNLIENALKYSPKDKPVTINLTRDKKHVVFSVEDSGNGIPEDEQEKIFEKFYRVGDEATRTTKGTGLGLYLCKMIARDHNAEISVSSVVGEGAVFTVSFKQ
jgi:two-component system sensor histidine kinase CiaH